MKHFKLLKRTLDSQNKSDEAKFNVSDSPKEVDFGRPWAFVG